MSVIESIDNLAQLRTYYPNGSNPQDGNIVYVKAIQIILMEEEGHLCLFQRLIMMMMMES